MSTILPYHLVITMHLTNIFPYVYTYIYDILIMFLFILIQVFCYNIVSRSMFTTFNTEIYFMLFLFHLLKYTLSVVQININVYNNDLKAKLILVAFFHFTDNPPAMKLCGQRMKKFNDSELTIPPSSSNEMYIRFHSGQGNGELDKRRFLLTITIKRLGKFKVILK